MDGQPEAPPRYQLIYKCTSKAYNLHKNVIIEYTRTTRFVTLREYALMH